MIEKKNKIYFTPINILRWFKCELRKMNFYLGEQYRKFWDDKRFSKLKKLKDSHTGDRCFIICTGPSLRLEDILLLKNEFTIGMNSICKLFSKTDWRPSIYGIQDILVYDRLVNELNSFNSDTICFIGHNIAKKRKISEKWIEFPLNVAYHDYDKTVLKRYYANFSDDCYRVVYNGYSITYSLLQIAVYLGFKEIYILGADNNYSQSGKHHFIEHGHFASDADEATFRLNAAYKCAKEFADKHKIEIYNVTRGGMLEVFPRKKLEDVINKKEELNNENSSFNTNKIKLSTVAK